MVEGSSETPFSLVVSETDLDALRAKLALTRFPDEIDDAAWEYGAPLADIRRLVARWQDGFDWRTVEAKINTLPQFTRDIEVNGFGTLNIHYIHQRSVVTGAIPLLFVHGWPGHFLEVRKILPLLTANDPAYPSFHVVALSLPGFGFSEAPRRKGFAATQYAELCNTLMLVLGYDQYVVQGGDWGSFIARYLAYYHGSTSVKAWHTNFPNVRSLSFVKHPWLYLLHAITPYTRDEHAGRVRSEWFSAKGRGYFYEQSTQPQTLGYTLADSPAGLLAWIYEKLVQWTDAYTWTDDEVLEWVSIYQFSRAGPAASIRIYYETVVANDYSTPTWSSVPLGLSFFPKELVIPPRIWARSLGNVVSEAVHGHGGHFAAHECPDALVGDVRNMFRKGGPAYAVVKGKDGY